MYPCPPFSFHWLDAYCPQALCRALWGLASGRGSDQRHHWGCWCWEEGLGWGGSEEGGPLGRFDSGPPPERPRRGHAVIGPQSATTLLVETGFLARRGVKGSRVPSVSDAPSGCYL